MLEFVDGVLLDVMAEGLAVASESRPLNRDQTEDAPRNRTRRRSSPWLSSGGGDVRVPQGRWQQKERATAARGQSWAVFSTSDEAELSTPSRNKQPWENAELGSRPDHVPAGLLLDRKRRCPRPETTTIASRVSRGSRETRRTERGRRLSRPVLSFFLFCFSRCQAHHIFRIDRSSIALLMEAAARRRRPRSPSTQGHPRERPKCYHTAEKAHRRTQGPGAYHVR